jgi:hypothetical protein
VASTSHLGDVVAGERFARSLRDTDSASHSPDYRQVHRTVQSHAAYVLTGVTHPTCCSRSPHARLQNAIHLMRSLYCGRQGVLAVATRRAVVLSLQRQSLSLLLPSDLLMAIKVRRFVRRLLNTQVRHGVLPDNAPEPARGPGGAALTAMAACCRPPHSAYSSNQHAARPLSPACRAAQRGYCSPAQHDLRKTCAACGPGPLSCPSSSTLLQRGLHDRAADTRSGSRCDVSWRRLQAHLLKAAEMGDLDKVRRCMAAEVDVNCKDQVGGAWGTLTLREVLHVLMREALCHQPQGQGWARLARLGLLTRTGLLALGRFLTMWECPTPPRL